MNIQMSGQERNLFILAIPRSLKKRSCNENANGQLQRYFPKCTEFIIAIYLKQVAARAALLRIINQRSDPISSLLCIKNQVHPLFLCK